MAKFGADNASRNRFVADKSSLSKNGRVKLANMLGDIPAVDVFSSPVDNIYHVRFCSLIAIKDDHLCLQVDGFEFLENNASFGILGILYMYPPLKLVDHLSKVLRSNFKMLKGQSLAIIVPDYKVPLMIYRLKDIGIITVQKFSRWRCKKLILQTHVFSYELSQGTIC